MGAKGAKGAKGAQAPSAFLQGGLAPVEIVRF